MDYTIFLKAKVVTIFVGSDPQKGTVPALTVTKVKSPQLVIDSDKGTITILETE